MDVRLLVIENAASDPLGRLAGWFAAAGATLDVLRPYAGDTLPATLPTDVRGLVVLGGPMGANDDTTAPWLPAERALLRTAVTAELPTLGICLGAQLLAAAHGGRVDRNPDGPELGAQLIAKRAAAATDPLFGPLPITPDVVQWHYDAVLDLPRGAVLLASSPGCDVQAFRLGRVAWGLQFHIEATPAVVAAWAVTDADRLADYDLARIVDRAEALAADVAEVWQPAAAAFVGVARDPATVPRARPIATTTAEPITDPAAIRAALAAEVQHARQVPGAAPLPWPGRGE